jgi:hypothetical protein
VVGVGDGAPHLIKKWQREIEAVIPDERAVIVKNLVDLHQVIAEQRIFKQRLVVMVKKHHHLVRTGLG